MFSINSPALVCFTVGTKYLLQSWFHNCNSLMSSFHLPLCERYVAKPGLCGRAALHLPTGGLHFPDRAADHMTLRNSQIKVMSQITANSAYYSLLVRKNVYDYLKNFSCQQWVIKVYELTFLEHASPYSLNRLGLRISIPDCRALFTLVVLVQSLWKCPFQVFPFYFSWGITCVSVLGLVFVSVSSREI